jgi:hypothetical protein
MRASGGNVVVKEDPLKDVVDSIESIGLSGVAVLQRLDASDGVGFGAGELVPFFVADKQEAALLLERRLLPPGADAGVCERFLFLVGA